MFSMRFGVGLHRGRQQQTCANSLFCMTHIDDYYATAESVVEMVWGYGELQFKEITKI